MKKLIFGIIVAVSITLTGCERMKDVEWKVWEKLGQADDTEVVITNVTQHTFLTPLLVVGHGARDANAFEYGAPASVAVQAMAEGGNIEPLARLFEAKDAQIEKDPHEGLLGPGESVTVMLDKDLKRLSIFAMVLPTNDGFIALDNAVIRNGEQELYAADAGTEANDERVTGGGSPGVPGIPADPNGKADRLAPGIAGVAAEGVIRRHAGISGAEGSALTQEVHGWKGPVASVSITIHAKQQ